MSDYIELESKIVTVRKNHACSWCAELIHRRNLAVSTSFVFDEALQRVWMHFECDDAHERLDWDEYPDGYMPGQFVRGQTYVPGEIPA